MFYEITVLDHETKDEMVSKMAHVVKPDKIDAQCYQDVNYCKIQFRSSKMTEKKVKATSVNPPKNYII